MRILLIEDNPGDALLVQAYLEEVDTAIYLENVTSLAAAGERLQRARAERTDFDALLVDLSLPDTQGLETVQRSQRLGLPIVVMTGLGDEATALAAVQAGAQDYLVKGKASGADIRRALRYAVERVRLNHELEEARQRAELLFALGEALQGARSPLEIFTLTSQRISAALKLSGMSLWHKQNEQLELRWATGSGATSLDPELERRALRALSHGETWFQEEASGGRIAAVKPAPDAATKPIAVMVVVREAGPWLETERSLLQPAAGTLGLALERADLIARLEVSNANLEVKTSMALEAARLVAWEWEIEADRLTLSSNAAEVLGSGAGLAYIASARLSTQPTAADPAAENSTHQSHTKSTVRGSKSAGGKATGEKKTRLRSSRTPPKLISGAPPRYPNGAKSSRKSGKVGVLVRVQANGLAATTRVYRSSGNAQLDQAAVTAAQSWKFTKTPSLDPGETIAVVVQVTFKL